MPAARSCGETRQGMTRAWRSYQERSWAERDSGSSMGAKIAGARAGARGDGRRRDSGGGGGGASNGAKRAEDNGGGRRKGWETEGAGDRKDLGGVQHLRAGAPGQEVEKS